MSNILPEDVKLMAEFMGIPHPCNTCFNTGADSDVVTCRLCSGILLYERKTPDYPKDMNALLGVMDKLEDDERKFYLATGYEVKEMFDVAVSSAPKFTDLPTVLFPLLVEAIKQIKESE